jgi:hypothetical protein
VLPVVKGSIESLRGNTGCIALGKALKSREAGKSVRYCMTDNDMPAGILPFSIVATG